MKRHGLVAALATIASMLPFGVLAQSFPSRPLTMVVPYAAGGAFDVVGRIWRFRWARSSARR